MDREAEAYTEEEKKKERERMRHTEAIIKQHRENPESLPPGVEAALPGETLKMVVARLEEEGYGCVRMVNGPSQLVGYQGHEKEKFKIVTLINKSNRVYLIFEKRRRFFR